MATPNYALQFTGWQARVVVPNSPVFAVSAVTIETWFMWDGSMGAVAQFLTAKGTENLEIHLNSGSANVRFIPTLGVYIDTPAGLFTAGQWYHLACAYDPAQSLAKIYVNGVEVPSWSGGPNPLNTPIGYAPGSSFYMGVREGVGYPLFGAMDEVRLWNYARSQAEIQASMTLSYAGSMPAGLIGSWRMNEGTGTSVADNSGNNLNGTFAGVPPPAWITSGATLTATVPLLDTVGVVALALMLAGGAVVILRRRQQALLATGGTV